MNPTERLEVIVDGIIKHVVEIQRIDGSLILKGDFLNRGNYAFEISEIKKMIERKAERNYSGKKIEIKSYI